MEITDEHKQQLLNALVDKLKQKSTLEVTTEVKPITTKFGFDNVTSNWLGVMQERFIDLFTDELINLATVYDNDNKLNLHDLDITIYTKLHDKGYYTIRDYVLVTVAYELKCI